MNKKASELTMTVIIIAVLALIVLVVMLFIFTGKMKGFDSGLKSCASLGGTCSGTVDDVTEGKTTRVRCDKGAPVPDTDCGTMVGCCIELG